jgi:hypothetical protein
MRLTRTANSSTVLAFEGCSSHANSRAGDGLLAHEQTLAAHALVILLLCGTVAADNLAAHAQFLQRAKCNEHRRTRHSITLESHSLSHPSPQHVASSSDSSLASVIALKNRTSRFRSGNSESGELIGRKKKETPYMSQNDRKKRTEHGHWRSELQKTISLSFLIESKIRCNHGALYVIGNCLNLFWGSTQRLSDFCATLVGHPDDPGVSAFLGR